MTRMTSRGLVVDKAMQELRGIPKQERRLVCDILAEGPRIPDEIAKDTRFAREVRIMIQNSRIRGSVERLNSLHGIETAPETVVNSEASLLSARLRAINLGLELALASGNPIAYMKIFRNTPPDRFYQCASDIFCNGREIRFRDRPIKQIEETTTILASLAEGTPEGLDRAIRLMRQRIAGERSFEDIIVADELGSFYGFFPPNEAMAPHVRRTLMKLSGDDEIEEPEVFGMELEYSGIYLLIEKWKSYAGIIRSDFESGSLRGYVTLRGHVIESRVFSAEHIGGIAVDNTLLVFDKNDGAVQHELQHLFDHMLGICDKVWRSEYRAMLAEMGYGKHPNRYERFVFENIVHEAEARYNGTDFPDHLRAERGVIRALLKSGIDFRSSIEIVAENCKRVLNEVYEQAVGLSYDQILAPVKMRMGI
ncbi:Uncharacterised protein [Candidatus Bilamarchaeum dharawalense]|uniref:Uncharacterized protein n=1 Tax=Candidatus Bilamarchaeum dharawalense TaxID=2885759 RepID=A0A5E4LRE3_9ARCH|nr:Uncharacterised protein [Candidatus Bilamarchaeum dharawalense]